MDAPLEGVFARDADRFFERADDAVTDPIARVAVRGEKMFARSVAVAWRGEERHNPREAGTCLRQEKGPLRPSTLSICDAGTGTSSMKMDPAAVFCLSASENTSGKCLEAWKTH